MDTFFLKLIPTFYVKNCNSYIILLCIVQERSFLRTIQITWKISSPCTKNRNMDFLVGVHAAHLLLLFGCFCVGCFVSSVRGCLCLWVVHSWLSIRFYLMLRIIKKKLIIQIRSKQASPNIIVNIFVNYTITLAK